MRIYPTAKQQDRIKKWPCYDFEGLLEYIYGLYNYRDTAIKKVWFKDLIFGWRLRYSISTGGWSGNEDIIEALLKNRTFTTLYYAEWYRGGHYVFIIDPKTVGYKLVKEYCQENKISRQAVYKSIHKYDVIYVSQRVVLIRKKREFILQDIKA